MNLRSTAFLTFLLVRTIPVFATPFVPDDPYFFTDTPTGFPGQWHLDKQTSSAQVDVNIRGAWERGLTGQGVTIGIVEHAFDWEHPDLSQNYSPQLSFDIDNDAPLPESSLGFQQSHPTSVAGVAAARGGNGIGVTGAAPYASLSSLRTQEGGGIVHLRYDEVADQRIAAAISFANGAGVGSININNYSFHPTPGFGYSPYPLAEEAIRNSAANGTINVFSAHNHRELHGTGVFELTSEPFFKEKLPFDADISKKTINRLPEVINVAALGADGTFAPYSNFGSSLTVTAPAGGEWWNPDDGLTTTDILGEYGYNGTWTSGPNNTQNPFPDTDYVAGINGTSVAAPLVSGVLALAKEAQPTLDTRFAKHLLATTSRLVDPLDSTPMGGWTTNAAGINFNNNYGFGLIDADALTLAATQYSGVSNLVELSSGGVSVDTDLPYNDDEGVTQSFTVDTSGSLEEVIVSLDIGGGSGGVSRFSTGDIEAILTSPHGTSSLLMYRNEADYHDDWRHPDQSRLEWSFLTNAFWGEDMAGEWELTVRDVLLYGPQAQSLDWSVATWNNFEVAFRVGELLSVASPLGDFDLDLDVDGNDFLAWQRNPSLGNLSDWQANYGTTASSQASSTSVPESASMLIAACFCILLLAFKREFNLPGVTGWR